jgi:2-polyprenyl-3-methyl-5-hydroxy-6-metoxy-1,4-benzoquinol methylase
MNEILSAAGYQLDTTCNVWSRPGYKSIAYSDGDEVENRIASVISSSQDVALSSLELRKHRIDWPSFYHLTSCRANILRPLEKHLQGAQVLEIGAGCGAVTRYLGEVGSTVLALEGSTRRAQMARSRTRDLNNVTVLSESFCEFNITHQFDVVTLIGVLEYARMFMPGDDPTISMLQRAKSLLKPGGILVVAIENKLGLKYFAGAPEDHTAQEMFGIESRYTPNGPVTFGYEELRSLLTRSGFTRAEFMSALPDYKATSSIVTEAGLAASDFDPSPLAQASVIRDRQLPQHLSFSINRAWRPVISNALGLHLANSFLVFASERDTPITDPSILGHHYSSDRIAPFCKSLTFCREQNGSIGIRYAPIYQQQILSQPIEGIFCVVQDHEPYLCGRLLSEDFASIVTAPGWTIEQVALFIRRYLTELMAAGAGIAPNSNLDDLSLAIPGTLVDATPQNIIVLPTGECRIIDTEWRNQTPITLGWLLFRALLCSINTSPLFEASGDTFGKTRVEFMHAVYHALGYKVSHAQIFGFASSEARWQEIIAGTPVRDDFWEPHQSLFGVRNIFEKSRYLEHRFHEALQEIQWQTKKHEQELSAASQQLNSLSVQLSDLLQSTSWRVTAPLRAFRQLGRKMFSSTSS